MADNIPFEMQTEIIKRLPIKSLAVFRSVSKAWKSMIDSPLFIADYTNFHQQHRHLISNKIIFADYYRLKRKYVSMVDNDTLPQQTVSNVPVSLELFDEPALVGTSQGLLCFSGYSREVGSKKQTAVIWNPTLGKSIAVDVPFPDLIGVTVFGFGVRPDSFDPMIVMVSKSLHPKPFLVFTLSSRGWRVPRGNLPAKSIYFPNVSPVATDDRRIYRRAYENSINLVVAFDMVCEDFTEIHLPHSVAHLSSDDDFSISIVKDSLALLDYDYNGDDERVCDVWMMVEDGVSKSFVKLFTINTPYASLRSKVLGFRKNDQPIMETIIHVNELCASLDVYEPRTGPVKNLGINGIRGSFILSSYTETLLLLDQLDEQSVKVQL